jgi:hypothetical protein
MGMMGKWMKTGTYFGIGIKLITIFPSEPIGFTIPILGLKYFISN